MDPEETWNRRRIADGMEMVLLVASVIGAVAGVLAFLAAGWLFALWTFLLALLCFAGSRMFRLVSELFACLHRMERDRDSGRATKDKSLLDTGPR